MGPMTDDAPDPGTDGPGGRAWVRRADTDRRSRLRATLEVIGGEGVVTLNDRRIPGSKVVIPLIAVAPAGVFVIDAKSHKGLVHTKQPGPMGRLEPPELHVGRRNCTPSLDALGRQVELVRTTLQSSPWGASVPVTAMLCLTRAEWGFATSARVRDVWVGWPRLVPTALRTPGVMDHSLVREVAGTLDTRLPAL